MKNLARFAMLSSALIALLSGGCSSSGDDDDDDDDNASDASDDSDDADNADSTDGSTSSVDYDSICSVILDDTQACSPGITLAQCVSLFERAETRGCEQWFGDLEEWTDGSSQAYGCVTVPGLPPVPTISSQAPEAAQLADACTGAVNRTGCYGISCESFTDCPTGSACNDATGHCVEDDASCGGLPCESFTDCPTDSTCNDALGVCING